MDGDPERGEEALVEWLRQRHPLIGDDAALLPDLGAAVVTVDSQREGVHFHPGTPLDTVARRLLAVNLSDLAACGARPRFALLALAAPEGFDHRAFLTALGESLAESSAELAGGDLSRADRLTATLTLLGTLHVEGRFLRRRDARPGDALWSSGILGWAAAGQRLIAGGAAIRGGRVRFAAGQREGDDARRAVRRYLEPTARLDLGEWLARSAVRTAVIDLSDGLAKELRRLCRASGVGARLEAPELDALAPTPALADDVGETPRSLALGGGDDYELLFTLPAGAEPPSAARCRRIGEITADGEPVLVTAADERPLPAAGWDHLTASS